jgi:hypothetical protein
MSVHRFSRPAAAPGRVTLRCDGQICRPRRVAAFLTWRKRKARALAARYGWQHRGRRDLCGTCAAAVYVPTGRGADVLREAALLRAELEAPA